MERKFDIKIPVLFFISLLIGRPRNHFTSHGKVDNRDSAQHYLSSLLSILKFLFCIEPLTFMPCDSFLLLILFSTMHYLSAAIIFNFNISTWIGKLKWINNLMNTSSWHRFLAGEILWRPERRWTVYTIFSYFPYYMYNLTGGCIELKLLVPFLQGKKGEIRPPKLKTEDPNKSYVQRPVKRSWESSENYIWFCLE